MQIACCQLDTVWQDKPASHARVTRLLDEAAVEAGGLVVLSEFFATGFSLDVPAIVEDERHETETYLADTARRYEVYMVGGVVNVGADGKGRNELVAFDPSGQLMARYCKLHPFSYARETEFYEPGERLASFQWQGLSVAPFICYDLRFPEVFRAAARRGAELIIVIANWPKPRREHWIALLRARAIENQAYVAAVNRCGSDPNLEYAGDSRIIDPQGNIIADAGDRECVIKGELDVEALTSYRQSFPALRDMRDEFFVE